MYKDEWMVVGQNDSWLEPATFCWTEAEQDINHFVKNKHPFIGTEAKSLYNFFQFIIITIVNEYSGTYTGRTDTYGQRKYQSTWFPSYT